MLTYVINTSENKVFDSSVLFELARYNKIRWYHCPMDKIGECAEDIYEKQNVLGADDFRIAVIVDFFNFDRLRVPYGRHGYDKPDKGVEMTVYKPYIEMYILDNLISYLQFRSLDPSDFEVYYIQNEKSEKYERFENIEEQLELLFNLEDRPQEMTDEEKEEFQNKPRSEFYMYCTPKLTLKYSLSSYPYGRYSIYTDKETGEEIEGLGMNIRDFWKAAAERMSVRQRIRRHYYISQYGIGLSRAALDTLSLSLYLIRMYEREEMSTDEEIEVLHLDSDKLKEVLENAWKRVNAVKNAMKGKGTEYYVLDQWEDPVDAVCQNPTPVDELISRERQNLPKDVVGTKLSAEELYAEIVDFSCQSDGEVKHKNAQEFDKIMYDYLKLRDETRESDIEAEFMDLKASNTMATTDRCPSKEQYEYLVSSKQKAISNLFEQALAADYIKVDYSEEKKRADDAYLEYQKARACMHRNIIGDILLLLFAVASMFVPYLVLQLTSYKIDTTSAVFLGINNAVLFAGLFILSLILQMIPQLKKLNRAKNKLYNCYLACCAKERYSLSAIRERYEKHLVMIEHARYELRQIKRLYNANVELDRSNAMRHAALQRLEDCLGGILNNLDVELVLNPLERSQEAVDVERAFNAKSGAVYQVFSVEVIEKMFPRKKGSD